MTQQSHHNSDWTYRGRPFTQAPQSMAGFVYCISHITTGKKYIGQKVFWQKKRLPPLKGRRNHRVKIVESNWKDYWGSSDTLLQDIERYRWDRFTREIICLCLNRSSLSYMEAWEIMRRNAITDDNYYNGIIHLRVKDSPALRDALSHCRSNGPPSGIESD